MCISIFKIIRCPDELSYGRKMHFFSLEIYAYFYVIFEIISYHVRLQQAYKSGWVVELRKCLDWYVYEHKSFHKERPH